METSEFAGFYDIRDAAPSDVNFILATFLRGLYYGDFYFSEIPKDIFMRNYKEIAQGLIKSPKVTIKIACLKEDPDIILGYSILSADYQAIVWVFVKSAWRRKGIAKALTPKHPKAVTHLSKLGKELMTKIPTAVFDPFYN